MSLGELEVLAQEIREVLIDTVARNGGHLAANLGVVELTLALHYVFNAPRDKIIWDVGHQSYPHKMVTGRIKDIESLRKYGGLSGFPKREESPYDAFNTGHSSTSISAAVGMALGRDLLGEDYSVIAVIGDGALTGGMAFEAINHAGHLGLDLTVVLNDNAMSISPNVGALSRYLNKMRSNPAYFRRKEEVEQALSRIPAIGSGLVKAAGKLKDMVKYAVIPGMLFEEFGFTYIGPIDGHSLPDIIQVFERARFIKGPVLIHVITQKGKGYQPALTKPDEFHGVGPFDISTGKPLSGKSRTYTQIFGDFMVEKAKNDPGIVAITAAMADGTGLTRFAELFPNRFFDVGICEQHAVTMAAGLAVAGFKPVVAIYSTFLQRSFDQIIHDVCLPNLPVVFAVDRAGLVGEDGPTHHGVFDLSYLRQIPNMTVMAPGSEDELIDMLESALSYQRPVAIRYPRGKGEGTAGRKKPEYIPLGTGLLEREGEDVLIIGIGRGVGLARKAARLLQDYGISTAVINARFAKPLDVTLICTWAKKIKRVVTVEDNVLAGGFGSAVMEVLVEKGIAFEGLRLGIPDSFVGHGAVDLLLAEVGLDVHKIVDSIRERWPNLERKRVSRGAAKFW